VGRGGSKPAAGDGSRLQRQELFISYSRKDRAFMERFWTHLSPLETQYGLQRWDDSRIQPGDIWLEEIEQALARAQVALLLVSPDFLASDFIRRKELSCLFEVSTASVSASAASPRTNSLPLNPLYLYPLAVGAAGALIFFTDFIFCTAFAYECRRAPDRLSLRLRSQTT
jgi:hypothetical protein